MGDKLGLEDYFKVIKNIPTLNHMILKLERFCLKWEKKLD
jgi:hypothetical protein